MYRNLYVIKVTSEVRGERMGCLINEIYWLLCILQETIRTLPYILYKGETQDD